MSSNSHAKRTQWLGLKQKPSLFQAHGMYHGSQEVRGMLDIIGMFSGVNGSEPWGGSSLYTTAF